jgi:hypothetical protein
MKLSLFQGSIGYPSLTESHNTLKSFNGFSFKPYGVLPSLSIMLEGKMVEVEVEVFDAPLDDCTRSKIFSLMDGFSRYNQINIVLEDQHKTDFIYPWGTFTYRKLPFGLKNVGTTFQCTMSYAFHDIKHIVKPYLDDLPSHSMCRVDQPIHLRAIFICCQFYHIRLNPHKCIFCVESGRLLGFIVSCQGIRVDPLKVEGILNLPPPSTLRQLQSLQGKKTFFVISSQTTSR